MRTPVVLFAKQLTLIAVCVLAGLSAPAQNQMRLEVAPGSTNFPVRLSSSVHENFVLSLEASTNFTGWLPAGVFHDALFAYPDLAGSNLPVRYYRLQGQPRVPTNDWKNQLVHPDPFLRFSDDGQLGWVKFALILDEAPRVYFQDGTAFPFHYDFAVQRLERFRGMDRAAFDAISLHRTNQQVLLGAVLAPSHASFSEYGIQFVGLDAYTPEQIATWFDLVKHGIHSEQGAAAYYVPTFEQSETVRTNKPAFDALGVPVAAIERWVIGNHAYSEGWALGTLKFFTASEIAEAFADGRLKPGDILLTDGVPAETPPVAGIISLRASTPNSHTAILARSFGIPFVYFPEAADQARLLALAGKKIILRATIQPQGASELAVFELSDGLTSEQEAALLALKKPAPINYSPKESFGSFSAPTDALTPADIRFFGGKAANYGFLRRFVPTNSPPAIAFSFDLWDSFMEQGVPGASNTLREEIALRLAPYTNFPPDIPKLKETLAGIRSLIRNETVFTAAQQQEITNSLQIFDKNRNIRFRSSTNVEDAENFTGAGLYDSYSGCLLDDLDNDTAGPSHCDPTETGERGVFRAIRRVYASFYNDNAFLERLRHGVNEDDVAMGVLVHHSFPDDDELANGVATIEWRWAAMSEQLSGEIVTQKGAESVTNPDGSSIPESVKVEAFGTSRFLTLTRYSSLVPLGARVMEWPKEYERFVDLFSSIAKGYREFYPAKSVFTLNFEYKKDRHLGLVVKQVREVPSAPQPDLNRPFLINEPTTLVVAQQEMGDVFANHRLKSVLQLHTANMWLVSSNLLKGIYTTGDFEFVAGENLERYNGDLATWPGAAVTTNGRINYWTSGSGADFREWFLETDLDPQAYGNGTPIFSQKDFPRRLTVDYQTPVPTISWAGETNTLGETVYLEPRRELGPGSILVERDLTVKNVGLQTSFYWPPPPKGIVAGYTAPLVKFVKTTITGLTSTPITLTNYYSQTYRPGHHNFSEDFIFEPALEPGLPPATQAELDQANIKLLYVRYGSGDEIIILGKDGKFRPL